MAASASAHERASTKLNSLVTTFLMALAFMQRRGAAALRPLTDAVTRTHNQRMRRTPKYDRVLERPDAQMGIMQQVKLVGGGVIGIAITVVIVNSVLTTGSINNSSGPFGGVIDSLKTTGESAMTLLVVGLLVVAGAAVLRYMDAF